jgi:hypothetical protein
VLKSLFVLNSFVMIALMVRPIFSLKNNHTPEAPSEGNAEYYARGGSGGDSLEDVSMLRQC